MNNDYDIRGENTAIIINSIKYGVLEFLISTNKLEKAKSFPNTWFARWSEACKTFYIEGRYKGKANKKTIFLHRFILNAELGVQVDHFNHNGLDNTDGNLRLVTQSQNSQNRRGAQANSKSGVLGVSWHKKANKWAVQISIEGKKKHFGLFVDLLEASKVAKESRIKYMPFSQEASVIHEKH